MLQKIIVTVMIILLPLVSGCTGKGAVASEDRREDVETLLERTERFLQDENETKIERFFSRDYYEGYDVVEKKIERRWSQEQILDLKLYVNRILEKDGLFNVQIKWNKSYLDAKGQSQKASGISELTLKPHKDSFRILNVTGDPLF